MTDLAARIVEAAGEAARRAMIVPGCCMEGTGCEMPPCHCSTVAARAALAAAVRESGLDRDELEDAAHEAAEEAEREMLLGIGNHVLTGKVAALLRALAGIADAR